MDKPATPNFLEAALNYMDAMHNYQAALTMEETHFQGTMLDLKNCMIALQLAYGHAKGKSLELIEWFDPAAKLPAEAYAVLVHVRFDEGDEEIWNAFYVEGFYHDPELEMPITQGNIVGWAYAPKGKRHG